jgi:uncharacterized membrane protein YbhN (UPF0104 family)
MGVHSVKNVHKVFFFIGVLNYSAFYCPLSTLDDDFCVSYGKFSNSNSTNISFTANTDFDTLYQLL